MKNPQVGIMAIDSLIQLMEKKSKTCIFHCSCNYTLKREDMQKKVYTESVNAELYINKSKYLKWRYINVTMRHSRKVFYRRLFFFQTSDFFKIFFLNFTFFSTIF